MKLDNTQKWIQILFQLHHDGFDPFKLLAEELECPKQDLGSLIEGLQLKIPSEGTKTITLVKDDLPFSSYQDIPVEQTNRFTEVKLLGQGGLGTIWRVQDKLLHRTLVSKRARNASLIARSSFLREAQICAQLQHNGIIPMYDIIESDVGELELLMREVVGFEFKYLIQRLPHHNESENQDIEAVNKAIFEGISLFKNFCQTIAYAHSRGVAHLDLKPANLMVGQFGETFVIDWGIAKPILPVPEDPEQDVVHFDITLEEIFNEGVFGTPLYMSPEQIQDIEVDHRSDIYALGIILQKMLFNPSFDQEQATSLINQKLEGDFDPFSYPISDTTQEGLNNIYNIDGVLEICRKATQPEKEDRYQDIIALIDEIDAWLSGSERRAKSKQHLEQIEKFRTVKTQLESQIIETYQQDIKDDFLPLRKKLLQLQKQKSELTSNLQMEYQKAIFHLVEDHSLIEQFIQLQLASYWEHVRLSEWKIARQLLYQVQLYVSLLPKDRQNPFQEKIQSLQKARSFNHPKIHIPRTPKKLEFLAKITQEDIVVVTGEPGVGKTHFLKDWCSDLNYQGIPFLYVDVQHCTDQNQLRNVIQKQLYPHLQKVLSIKELILSFETRGFHYLVLDNTEQFSSSAEQLLQQLISQNDAYKIVFSSRRKHSLPSQNILSLNTMSPLEAVELFVQNLDYNQRMGLTDESVLEISQLCQLLDYLPLSIQLLSNRAKRIPLNSLNLYLQDRFQLLENTFEQSKSSSLWETLEWSWNLLSPTQQRVLAECSLFSGSFSQKECLEILTWTDKLQILSSLETLEDFHFISWSEDQKKTPRYRLLVVIHEFATQKLHTTFSKYAQAAKTRISQYFIQTLDRHYFLQDLEQVLPHCIQATKFQEGDLKAQLITTILQIIRWTGQGYLGQQFYNQHKKDSLSPEVLANLLLAEFELYIYFLQISEAEDCLDDLVVLFDNNDLENTDLYLRYMLAQAKLLQQQQQYLALYELLNEMLVLVENATPITHASILEMMGDTCQSLSKLDEAWLYFQKGIEICGQKQNIYLLSLKRDCLCQSVIILHLKHQFQESLIYIEQASQIVQEIGSPVSITMVEELQAKALGNIDQIEHAIELLDRSLETCRKYRIHFRKTSILFQTKPYILVFNGRLHEYRRYWNEIRKDDADLNLFWLLNMKRYEAYTYTLQQRYQKSLEIIEKDILPQEIALSDFLRLETLCLKAWNYHALNKRSQCQELSCL